MAGADSESVPADAICAIKSARLGYPPNNLSLCKTNQISSDGDMDFCLTGKAAFTIVPAFKAKSSEPENQSAGVLPREQRG
jgi:hypothetical protein